MTSSTNLRQESVWTDKLFEMINQGFQTLGRKYQLLPNSGICCRELRGLKVTSFRACVRSFCSVTTASIVIPRTVMLLCSFTNLMGVKCILSLVNNTGSGGFAVSSLIRSPAHYSQVQTWPKMWNGKRIWLAFREAH